MIPQKSDWGQYIFLVDTGENPADVMKGIQTILEVTREIRLTCTPS